MMTHYIPAFAPINGSRALAVCRRYVDYSQDSDKPTCEDCQAAIAAEEADKRLEQQSSGWGLRD